jgi:hypothetical protein
MPTTDVDGIAVAVMLRALALEELRWWRRPPADGMEKPELEWRWAGSET